MEPRAQFVKLVLSKSVKRGIRTKTKVWALTPVVFAMLAVLVGLVLLVACGGDSRVGSTITRYELQPGDCYNVPEDSTRILLVDCSSAEKLVLHTITLEDSEFEGSDWMNTKANRICQAATEGETDKFWRPSASTWSFGDRLVVCEKLLDESSDDDSNTGSSDDDSNTGSPDDDSNTGSPDDDSSTGSPDTDSSTGSPDTDSSSRIGTTQGLDDLQTGDCYDRLNPGFYITQCSQAEEKVLKVVFLVDGPWPGGDAITRAARDFCPSGTDIYFVVSEGRWADGIRRIVCREDLRASVPLYDSDVRDFSKGFVRGSGSQLEAANRALDKAIDSGQQVIECQYGPSDPVAQTGYTSYGFWYEDVPDNIDELLRVAGDSGVPDPVFHLGTNSTSSCPDSKGEGEAAWRAGR